ncbi:MAG: carbon storage regulator [Planctomycetales bacterium]|nr:carbon storage regulator [Planctomycetales bacterium]
MLVLSRKTKQRIVIGPDIELIVVAVSGDRVKLGFKAPHDVPIHREEVRRRLEAEEAEEAAQLREADGSQLPSSANLSAEG